MRNVYNFLYLICFLMVKSSGVTKTTKKVVIKKKKFSVDMDCSETEQSEHDISGNLCCWHRWVPTCNTVQMIGSSVNWSLLHLHSFTLGSEVWHEAFVHFTTAYVSCFFLFFFLSVLCASRAGVALRNSNVEDLWNSSFHGVTIKNTKDAFYNFCIEN